MAPGNQAHAVPSSRRVTLPLAGAGAVLVVLGVGTWFWADTPTAPQAPDPGAGAPTTPGEEEGTVGPLPREVRVTTEWGAPVRLEVPVLDIDAPIVPIGAPGGVLTPPSDPQSLGWWADGARPGDRSGSALVTGHTVSVGGGALDDLEDLERGDRVWVGTKRGRLAYDVRSVVVLGKGDLAEQAPRLFDQDVSGRLVLITCEDWNGAEYLSNVVVTATPA